MNKFKIGDWVRYKETDVVFQILEEKSEYGYENFQSCWDFHDGYEVYKEKDLNEWFPKAGEWCWLKTDKTLKMFKFNQPAFNQAFYHGYNPLIEPFIGELPSFLEDK